MIVIQLVALFVLVLVIAGLFAPWESISWWAREGREDARELPARAALLAAEYRQMREAGTAPESPAPHFLVFLSGVGISSHDALPLKETPLVDELERRLGDTILVRDVYPYSPDNRGLTTRRTFAWLWRRLAAWKLEHKAGVITFSINIRNAFQMFVSADRRYGPVYNLGVAEEIHKSLLRHGYVPGSQVPVTVLGWSGGGQIAVGCAWYLASFGVPVRVISMAGIFSADPGIERALHVWHLYGSLDKVHWLSKVWFPGRWSLAANSAWNRALRDGRATLHEIGPLAHSGESNYFAGGPALADGRAPRDHSVDAIIKILASEGLAFDRDPEASTLGVEPDGPAPTGT